MLTGKQRAALRTAANTLEPVFLIGKEEIGDTMIAAIEACIASRELIKIKCLETAGYSAKEAAEILAPALNAECVQVIGHKFVLFRKKNKESAFEEILNPAFVAKPKAAAKKVSAKKPTAKMNRWGKPDYARSGEHSRSNRPAGQGHSYGYSQGQHKGQEHGNSQSHSNANRFGHGPRFGGDSHPNRFSDSRKKQG